MPFRSVSFQLPRRPTHVGRVRPGERPTWIELPLADDELDALRQRAAGVGVPVDAWVAVLMEARLAPPGGG
jgi:hypothetical protein